MNGRNDDVATARRKNQPRTVAQSTGSEVYTLMRIVEHERGLAEHAFADAASYREAIISTPKMRDTNPQRRPKYPKHTQYRVHPRFWLAS